MKKPLPTTEDRPPDQEAIETTLTDIRKLYHDASMISDALTVLLRRTAIEPELYARLNRVQNLIGDLLAGIRQVLPSP